MKRFLVLPIGLKGKEEAMRKSILLFLLTVVLQLALFFPAQANQQLRVGVYANYPLVFVDENGKAGGFLIDILEHISSGEKWEIDYVPGTWTDCLERL